MLMLVQLDDTKNWNRWGNIRILNLPEGLEQEKLTEYLKTWLPAMLRLIRRGASVMIVLIKLFVPGSDDQTDDLNLFDT